MDVASLAAILAQIGPRAGELGKVFLRQSTSESGRLRLFLQNFFRKPLTWLFTVIFSPLILIFTILKNIRALTRNLNAFDSARLSAMIIGLSIASVAFWLAGSWLGTFGALPILLSIFGPLTTLGFLIGTTFSIAITVSFQILLFNSTCFLFLKITKRAVVSAVWDEFITEDSKNS